MQLEEKKKENLINKRTAFDILQVGWTSPLCCVISQAFPLPPFFFGVIIFKVYHADVFALLGTTAHHIL